jgi:hypothetical protein
MTSNSQKRQPLPEVLNEYVESLEQYLLAQREKRFIDGNKFVDVARKAATALRHEFGSEGRKAMLALLNHPDSGIRLSVASDVLDFAIGRAAKVLDDIEKANRPFEGTAAHYCLKEWRADRKQFPGGHVTLEPKENYD